MSDVMKRLDLLSTKRMDLSLPEWVQSSAVDVCCDRSISVVGLINDGLQSRPWSSSSAPSTAGPPAAVGPAKSYSSAAAAIPLPVRQPVRVHGSRQLVVASMGNTDPSPTILFY